MPETAAALGPQPRSTTPSGCARSTQLERDKRLRADGNEQYVEVKGDFPTTSTIPMSSRASTARRCNDEVEVLIIGGGFGGLMPARAAARGRRRRHPHHREGRRLRRHLVLEPLSRRAVRHRDLHLPAAARRDSATSRSEKYSFAPEIREHAASASRGTSTSTTTRCSRPTITELRWDEDDEALDGHAPTAATASRRATWSMSNGPLNRPEAARHSRHRRVQGPHLPHQPLGLRLYRRRRAGGLTKLPTSASASSAPARPRSSACRISAEWAQQLYVFQRTPSLGRRARQPADRSGMGRRR